MEKRFNGDKKIGESLFGPLEQKLITKTISAIPTWIETYHLTLLTIPWCLLILLFSWLARENIHWLWVVSLMIFFQYITDLYDGAVGRFRNTGLIKWGYYMDHFLDYFFLFSILIGYAFILPVQFDPTIFFIFAIMVGFMVNSYLAFAASNAFRISYWKLGPTEMRLVCIAVNTLLVIFGKTYMARALPYVFLFATVGLIAVVYRTQKELWEIDMQTKIKKML